ncbi:MAG: HD domain-containing protein [Lachnospiraceae bacterium]|nr:HD domain-containing protein [Lachnospiraceae bacterium]MCR4803796.1 HD domain-containing protein [Lachnospiraceae bacterium]
MERYHQILTHPLFQETMEELGKLEKERKFCNHTLEHFCDVARIMYIFSLEEQSELSQDMIYATALLHDLGRVAQYKYGEPHHEAGKKVAEPILKDCGYDAEEIGQILGAIGCHRKEIEEADELSLYLYRADKLSRNCFACKAVDECYWPEEKRNHTITV